MQAYTIRCKHLLLYTSDASISMCHPLPRSGFPAPTPPPGRADVLVRPHLPYAPLRVPLTPRLLHLAAQHPCATPNYESRDTCHSTPVSGIPAFERCADRLFSVGSGRRPTSPAQWTCNGAPVLRTRSAVCSSFASLSVLLGHPDTRSPRLDVFHPNAPAILAHFPSRGKWGRCGLGMGRRVK